MSQIDNIKKALADWQSADINKKCLALDRMDAHAPEWLADLVEYFDAQHAIDEWDDSGLLQPILDRLEAADKKLSEG